MSRIACATAGLVLFAIQPAMSNQIGRIGSFDERMAEADLVVIATKGMTLDTKRGTVNNFPVVEVATDFSVAVILKGVADRTLILRHYRWDRERLGPGGVVNAPHELVFAGNGGFPPDYLLFLKKDADGTFSPVSGHVFPEDSVFSLRRPR